jgi:uncharacterized alpha/beta hydrolase family protein
MVSKKFVIVIAIVAVAIAIGAAIFTSSANRSAQTSISGGNPSSPVLLVHGLGEDASMWKKWEELLAKDGIQYHTITKIILSLLPPALAVLHDSLQIL